MLRKYFPGIFFKQFPITFLANYENVATEMFVGSSQVVLL